MRISLTLTVKKLALSKQVIPKQVIFFYSLFQDDKTSLIKELLSMIKAEDLKVSLHNITVTGSFFYECWKVLQPSLLIVEIDASQPSLLAKYSLDLAKQFHYLARDQPAVPVIPIITKQYVANSLTNEEIFQQMRITTLFDLNPFIHEPISINSQTKSIINHEKLEKLFRVINSSLKLAKSQQLLFS